MYPFIAFCYPNHYKTFATATSNTIGGHLGKGKNVQVGIKAVYLTLRLFYFHVTAITQRKYLFRNYTTNHTTPADRFTTGTTMQC
jgi:hypothetical protein